VPLRRIPLPPPAQAHLSKCDSPGIDLTGIDIYRVVDGKLVEQWIEQDLLGLLRQLGAVRIEHMQS
jgi:SnoaL-like polyketide cyclase